MNIINDYKQLRIIESLKFAEENKKLKEELDFFRKAHDNEQAKRRIFEQKLEKIKEFCNYCSNVEHSGCALCKYDCEEPTAFILSIVEGAENEN